jgi:ribose 5-phosphate isomerase A
MAMVRSLGQALREGKLKGIRAVATSLQTEIACEEEGIPLFALNSREIGGELDLAIDGADEIDPRNCLTKGGGAAHLREKVVEYSAKLFVAIADESKVAKRLGLDFPIPVEVVPFARASAELGLLALGAKPTLREAVRKAGPVVTDNGNIVFDCVFPEAFDPAAMEAAINMIPGVVENGIFARKRAVALISRSTGEIEVRE